MLKVSLGIPACEMLDLAAITQTPGTRERERSDSGPTERSFRAPHPAEDCSPLEPAVVAMSVKARRITRREKPFLALRGHGTLVFAWNQYLHTSQVNTGKDSSGADTTLPLY